MIEAGTTASSQPAYDITIGATTTDGTSTLKAYDSFTRVAWVEAVTDHRIFTLGEELSGFADGWFDEGDRHASGRGLPGALPDQQEDCQRRREDGSLGYTFYPVRAGPLAVQLRHASDDQADGVGGGGENAQREGHARDPATAGRHLAAAEEAQTLCGLEQIQASTSHQPGDGGRR